MGSVEKFPPGELPEDCSDAYFIFQLNRNPEDRTVFSLCFSQVCARTTPGSKDKHDINGITGKVDTVDIATERAKE